MSAASQLQACSGISGLTFQILVCEWNNCDPPLSPLPFARSRAWQAQHLAELWHKRLPTKEITPSLKKRPLTIAKGDNRPTELHTAFLHMLLTHEVGNIESFFNEHHGG